MVYDKTNGNKHRTSQVKITTCIQKTTTQNRMCFILNSNMNSFFRFVNKRANYPFGIISLAHAPVNVTDSVSIGSINCNQNNADRGRSIIQVT